MPNGDGTQIRVALQPADTKLQARFAMSVVVILILRGLSLRVRIYVMTPVRTTAGINKREDAGMIGTQIGFADAVRRIFPTALASYP